MICITFFLCITGETLWITCGRRDANPTAPPGLSRPGAGFGGTMNGFSRIREASTRGYRLRTLRNFTCSWRPPQISLPTTILHSLWITSCIGVIHRAGGVGADLSKVTRGRVDCGSQGLSRAPVSRNDEGLAPTESLDREAYVFA